MRVSNVLTILDKPTRDQRALMRSVELQAAAPDAHLDVVAFRWDALLDHGEMFDAKQRRTLRHKLHTECEAWQEALIAESKAIPSKTRHRMVWTKDIAGWLSDELTDKPQDLVVKSMGKQRSMFMTPLDWQIARTCPAPILFTGNVKKKRSKRILVALDFKQSSAKHRRHNAKILQAADCMAELYDAQIHCMFVVEISPVLRDLDVIDAKVSKRSVLDQAMPDIERAVAPYRIPKSRLHFPVGKPSKVIAGRAQQMGADLLVVGTWAHRVKQTIGLGNTAETILNKISCDVLTVSP